MAGASFALDMAEASAMFAAIRARGRNLRPLMTEIGAALEASTRKRFRSERSPDNVPWAPISAEWRAEKIERGFAPGILKMRGDLLNSVRFEADESSATVIASQPYAAIHQFGGTIRPRTKRALKVRGKLRRSVKIPARPYMGASTEDIAEILDAARDFLDRASRRK